MSLKWFHLFFISVSVVMSVTVGLWGLFNQYVLLGAGSLAGAVALSAYGTYFFQKARTLALAALLVVAAADPAWACPVCFGASDSPAVQGMRWAIVALLIVTAAVLGGFAAFFVYLMRRARAFGEPANAHEGSY